MGIGRFPFSDRYFVFDPERRLMFLDVESTLDKCRFTYQGVHVSKEIARDYYRRTEWYKAVEEAKRTAVEKELGIGKIYAA
jgi:phosphoribosylaminoimidazole-succinocarboxamide synthase